MTEGLIHIWSIKWLCFPASDAEALFSQMFWILWQKLKYNRVKTKQKKLLQDIENDSKINYNMVLNVQI